MLLTLLPAILGALGSLLSLFTGKTSSVNTVTGASVAQTQDVVATETAMLQAESNAPNQAAAVAGLESGRV